MSLLGFGLLLFIGIHSLAIVSPAAREALMLRCGPGLYRALFSLVALAGLVLIVYGYGQARSEPLFVYVPPAWLRPVAVVLLLPVFVFAAAAYLPGRIRQRLRHPLLVAVKLWAAAHLLVNGTLADIVLFGALLAWAVADRISLKRRPPRDVPAAAITRFNDAAAVAAGLALYAILLLGGHAWLVGVPVLAG